MKIEHNGTLMRIYVAESRRYRKQGMFHAIIKALATAEIGGVIAFKGIEGFGSHRYVSTQHAVDAWVDLPILIEVVDEDDKIRAFIPTLEEILDDGLVTLERIQTLIYRPASSSSE